MHKIFFLRLLSFSLLLCLLSTSRVFAQSGEWKSLRGPDGGIVQNIVISPEGDVYVEGIFGYFVRMSDDLRFRTLTNNNDTLLQSVAVDSNSNTYGASGSLVCRIKNGVVDLSDTLGRPFKDALLKLRILPNNILAAEHGRILAKYIGGKWVNDTLPVSPRLMVAKADSMFAFDGETIYVRVGSKPWSSHMHGLNVNPTSVALSPWGILVSTSRDGVFLSPAPYDTLISISDNLPDWLISQVIYADGCIVAGGDNNLYTTSDLGNSWIPGNGRLKALPVPVLAAHQGTWYAGTAREGLFSSVDKGQSWQAVNGGILNTQVNSIIEYRGEIWTGSLINAIHAYNPITERWVDRNEGMRLSSTIERFVVVRDTLYAIDERSGLYRWHTDSSRWTKIPLEFTISSHYTDMIAIDDNTLIVISEYPYRVNLTTWVWERLPLGLFPLYDIEQAGQDLYITSDSIVFHSSDRGTTWSEFISASARRVTVHQGTIFVRVNSGVTIRSSNNGASWDTLDTNPVLETYNGTLYGLSGSILIMTNDGSSSHPLTTSLSDDRETFYITEDGRIFENGGRNGLYQFILSSSVKAVHADTRSVAYPNPASYIVNLPEGDVVIHDAIGQRVYTTQRSEAPIDVSQWSDGIYFYKTESADGVHTGRFVVRH